MLNHIIQIKGPKQSGYSYNLNNVGVYQKTKIGISVKEKDYMERGNPNNNNQICIYFDDSDFEIPERAKHIIEIGKTQRYETQFYIPIKSLSFPNGLSEGTIIEIEKE